MRQLDNDLALVQIEVDIRHGPGIVKTQKVTVVLVQIVHSAKIQNPRVFNDLPLNSPKNLFYKPRAGLRRIVRVAA
jgi:hypothetical protein